MKRPLLAFALIASLILVIAAPWSQPVSAQELSEREREQLWRERRNLSAVLLVGVLVLGAVDASVAGLVAE